MTCTVSCTRHHAPPFWLSPGHVSPCLPLSPHMCACVGWCVHLPEVLSPLVSHCLTTCLPVLDGVSAFPKSFLPLSRIVSPHVSLCWMMCPPSRGLVSVSHCRPTCVPVLDGVPAFPRSCLPLSPLGETRPREGGHTIQHQGGNLKKALRTPNSTLLGGKPILCSQACLQIKAFVESPNICG